ncbi:MAG: phosphoglycerate mutase [Actinomycetales bacterium]|nr:MAG: phosphoglycerate mutase [Actinomycetales bacterium]
MPTVLLVRHGRTSANTGGTLAGWTPGVELDETGRAQVLALAARIAEAQLQPVQFVSSPLHRCLQTAELLQTQLHQAGSLRDRPTGVIASDREPTASTRPTSLPDTQVDERLGECHYGAWTGQALTELAKEPLWRVVQDHPSAAAFPDGEQYPGESLTAMSARAVAAIREHDRVVAATHGEHAVWVAVSHGDVIKAVLADALGMHLDLYQRIRVDPASVSVFTYAERRPIVHRINDLGGPLAGVVPAAGAPGESGDGAVGGGAGAEPAQRTPQAPAPGNGG